MIKVLFVCYGNICRSPMAEFLFKDMISKKGLEKEFYIQSAGTSNEEEGSPVYDGAQKKLAEFDIRTDGKVARQLKKEDYDKFDYIIAMELMNIRDIHKIIDKDEYKKVYRLLDFSDTPRDIADPWYTRNFEVTYDDIMEGLEGFFNFLKNKKETNE